MTPDPPPLDKEEQLRISRAKTDIDTLMQRLGEPPEKFKPSSGALNNFLESYRKLETFTLKPAGTVDGYPAATKKLEDECRNSGKALKEGLPKKLAVQLEEVKAKNKTFQDF